ncbi:uncharacterized protein SPPG_03588 [Spizellomyces punctatus DAOM BR117]|uniref:Uncharacterized protein n=1 Tax=Spizellomyces punctatus (strain DAOM BR117) TaxID=645134 RepID=A0A0L0HKZ8_SPIPD|nr:uncharacterized protein SPPG_03588 [Spizellomyces punctatus DAOM BR117]KND01797.1 hypothetical protein SPPG_03588 [Spizellomyces punctatus DAOM BR117]|eukprot:XP_016609836.1 hypothetical protein SPPG_03588 [Spizellomyces punctatus DAOM BR117]
MHSERYTPTVSLLESILVAAPPQERDELRGLLGEHLVGQVEELELEARMLMEIHEEYRQETDKSFVEGMVQGGIGSGTFHRSALIQKIRLLLDNFKEVADDHRSQESILENEQDIRIVNYIHAEETSRRRRPISSGAGKRPGSTPALLDTGQVKNILDATDVLSQFRRALMSEKDRLLTEVEALRQAMDDERDHRSKAECVRGLSPPSIQDLRSFSDKLENKWRKHERKADLDSLLDRNQHAKTGPVLGPITAQPRPPSIPPTAPQAPRVFRVHRIMTDTDVIDTSKAGFMVVNRHQAHEQVT